MPFDTKTLKRDGSGITPVPQHFNPTADDYEPQYGRNGASRVEIYGPDGTPISTSAGKLAVRASEIETLLSTLNGKDFATQTTLAEILAKIIAAPATEAKQTALNALVGEVQASPTANTLLARLKSLEDKIDKITAGTTPAVTTLSGSLPVQTVITRAVYSTTQTYNCEIPKGAKYAVVSSWIQGVTGTFTTGQGLTVSIGTTIGGFFTAIPLAMAFPVTVSPNQRLLGVWGHDYTVMGDVAKSAQVNTLKSTPLPLLGEKLCVSATITGTFEVGQGFDLISQVIFYN